MRVWITGLLSLVLGLPGIGFVPQTAAPPGEKVRVLYFFFSPESRAGAEAAKKATDFVKAKPGEVRLRPVILVERFQGIGKLDEKSPLYRTLKELQSQGPLDIPLYDEEGLRLAEIWEIRSLPAFVLVSRGRAHRALDPRASLDDLWECNP
jgi:hypothetical protein